MGEQWWGAVCMFLRCTRSLGEQCGEQGEGPLWVLHLVPPSHGATCYTLLTSLYTTLPTF